MAEISALEPNFYIPRSLRAKYTLKESLLVSDTSSADISWEPDYEKYQKRSEWRSKLPNLAGNVPKEFTFTVKSALNWSSHSFEDEKEYVVYLQDEEKKEINAALSHFKGLKLDVGDLSKENFPLPTLASRLRVLADELYAGKGFFILRGLRPTEYSGEDNSLIFIGISKYIAPKLGRQDSDRNMIVHILDATSKLVPEDRVQSVWTPQNQPFHSDVVCDILALQTLGCSASGGDSSIASVWTIYNEITSTRPDLIHTLSAPDWVFDTFGRDPPYHKRALLFFYEGKISLNFSRRLITGNTASPRTKCLPPITEAQAEALDAVHFLAEKHKLTIHMQPGDLRFINNLAILHSRDAFTDSVDSHRHLVRLWLRDDDKAWPTPPGLQMAWDRIYAKVDDEDDRWDLEPALTPEHVVSRKRSCGQG